MKKLIVTFCVTALTSVASIAGSSFEGYYGQGGVGYENNKVGAANPNYVGSHSTTAMSYGSGSSNSGQINFGMGFNKALNSNYLIGAGFEYSSIKSSSFAGGDVYESGTDSGSHFQNKVSNRYSIFVSPAVLVGTDGLGYLKVGYTSEKLQQTMTEVTTIDANQGHVISGNANGYILGLGYKQLIKDGYFSFAEANYYGYNAPSLSSALPSGDTLANNNPKPTAYSIIFGIGYKF